MAKANGTHSRGAPARNSRLGWQCSVPTVENPGYSPEELVHLSCIPMNPRLASLGPVFGIHSTPYTYTYCTDRTLTLLRHPRLTPTMHTPPPRFHPKFSDRLFGDGVAAQDGGAVSYGRDY